MTKTYTLNAISKAFLVLALANGLALFSVSAGKNKDQKHKEEQTATQAMSTATTTKVVTPSNTLATLLVSTFPMSTGPLPASQNKNIDNGKLVSGGTLLANNINPYKIGTLVNGKYTPLQAGQKPGTTFPNINADNYFRDEAGTTNFGGNVSIAKDLTITGTLISSSGQFCMTSDIALSPANTLYVNTINPVKLVGGACVADNSNCAVTTFNGDISVKGRRFGTINNVTLDSSVLNVLKLHFTGGAYDHTLCAPAAVKIHFVGYGTDVYDDCFSVCFTQEVVVSPDSDSFCNISDPVNCFSSTPDVDNVVLSMQRYHDEYDVNVDAYIGLNIYDDGDNDMTYHGCVFYEIIGCENLTGIECLPNLV